MISLLVRE